MPEPSLFRHYQIVQDSEGANVELVRNQEQVAVLAYDTRRLEYVHCHVLLSRPADPATFEEGCRQAQRAGHPLLARLGEFGEDEGNPFYITGHVDGETLRSYLARQPELPGWLAVMIASRALEAASAVSAYGDLLPESVLDSFRIVQTGPHTVLVQLADYRLLPRSTPKPKGLKSAFEKQAKQLKDFLKEQCGGGPTLPDTLLPAADFTELLSSCLSGAGPETLNPLRELRQALHKLVPEHLGGEIPTAHKPRALLAPLLATYQEVARGVVNLVRIQSQRLDMANPYAMRGTLTKTGRAVLVEQIPPADLSSSAAAVAIQKAHQLAKKREHPGLVQVVLLHEGDDLTCMAEEAVEGITLADLLRERKALQVSETYLVLAGLDAALTQLEGAALETRRLRLEDIYLLTGFPREDARTTKLLLSKLNEWPTFSVMLRGHPTLAAMSGRGTDPALLLPAQPKNASGTTPWHAAWLAALGRFLLGLEALPGVPAETAGGSRERETVARLLEDEISKCTESTPGKRADFLARFARVIQHHDLVKPVTSPPSEPLEVITVKPGKNAGKNPPPAREPAKQANPPAPSRPAQPAPAATRTGGSATVFGPEPVAPEEKPTIGFAELLFQGTSESDEEDHSHWTKTAVDAPPTIHPHEALLPPGDYVPLWLRVFVFVGGSMVAGGIWAHVSGDAFWLKPGLKSPPIKVQRTETPTTPGTSATPPRALPVPEPVAPAQRPVPKAIPLSEAPAPLQAQPVPEPPPAASGLRPPASSLRDQIVDLPATGR